MDLDEHILVGRLVELFEAFEGSRLCTEGLGASLGGKVGGLGDVRVGGVNGRQD